MILDFSRMRITLVVTPFDMRAGYRTLAAIAQAVFGLEVDKGGEAVLFVSKSREICKLIWSDEKGTSLITRKLRRGRFERFLCRANEPATHHFSAEDLNDFLDGVRIMVLPRSSLSA